MPQTPSTTYSAIDVVYTYLNGENQCYRKKYAAATGTDINDIRCVDHGELAFSVDLMLRHLPWVRTVHIVYGGNEIKQETLRALEALSGYRRLNLVPQEDVLPAAYRGTFSSCTVEAYLHRIEGLSEWFFYLNDDMCVGRPMVWADFFDAKANRPFIDLSRRRTDVDYNQAQRHNTNALRLFQSRHDTATERVAVSHQASLLHRPSCEQALRLFADELAACHREPFRTDSTLNFQLLASLVAERDRRATIRVGRQHHGILCVMAECQAPLMEFILTLRPAAGRGSKRPDFGECSTCRRYRSRHNGSPRSLSHVIRERIAVLEGPCAAPRCYQCRATASEFAYLIHQGIDQRLCRACVARVAKPRSTAPDRPPQKADDETLTEQTSQIHVKVCTTCRCAIPSDNVVGDECTTCHRYRQANGGAQRPRQAITKDWIRKTAKEANPDRYARCQKCGTTHTLGWCYVLDEQMQHGIRVCQECGGRNHRSRPSQLHLLSCVTCAQMFSSLQQDDRECATCCNYRKRTGRKRPTKLITHRDVIADIKAGNPDNRPSCHVCGSFFANVKPHSAKKWTYAQGKRLCTRCAPAK